MAWPYKENLLEGIKVNDYLATNERILLPFGTFYTGPANHLISFCKSPTREIYSFIYY